MLLRVERDPGAQALPRTLGGLLEPGFCPTCGHPPTGHQPGAPLPTLTQALWALGKEEEGGGPGPLLHLAWLNYQQDLGAL